MGALGLPLAILGTGLAAGGAAYGVKKVIDIGNDRAAAKAQADLQPQIQDALTQAQQSRALLNQQKSLAQAQAAASVPSTGTGRKRLAPMPGIYTSPLGAVLGNSRGTTQLGN